MKTLKILAVDDHKMTVLGYKYILEEAIFDDIKVEIDIETKYELAKRRIENSAKKNPYDILLLDIQLFPSEAKDPRSGEDLGKLARELVPESKIVYMSSFGDAYRINSIFRSVNPDGYLIKSEIDENTLHQMVRNVSKGETYYSQGANSIMRKTMSHSYKVDDLDKIILYQLSIGSSVDVICDAVSLSTSAVESRKRQMKSVFEISGKNDFSLIEEARNRGYI